MVSDKQIARLTSALHDKVWGTENTEPWLKNPQEFSGGEGRKIGEIWFAASPQFPLLVKLLFTSARLSVQVHPNDSYARKHHNSPGKTEMWRVLRAQPGAEVALGLREPITKNRLREAAQSGEIQHLLNWIPARKGDTFFIPAGTIHAIGAGLVLCEVQQLSDLTYRLYDYGRPRELHLDHALSVSNLTPYVAPPSTDCEYFQTRIVPVNGSLTLPPPSSNTLHVMLEGEARINGEPFRAGEAWETTPASGSTGIEGQNATFLQTHRP